MYLFYLNGEDKEAQKKCLTYLLKNKLFTKIKTGKLYDVTFKYDSQNKSGDEEETPGNRIRLSDYVDQKSGEL